MNRWIMDPGSNIHVCNSKAFGWVESRKAQHGDVLYSGNSAIKVEAWGTVVLNINTPSGLGQIQLTNVALIHGFFANILGLSRCRSRGIHFDSGRDLLYMKDHSNVIAKLEYNDSHWLVDAEENDRLM